MSVYFRIVVQACDFAARRHVNQRRKGAQGEPYINHLAEVAMLLATATAGKDAELVAAGYLHDTLEDTPTEYEELRGSVRRKYRADRFGGD